MRTPFQAAVLIQVREPLAILSLHIPKLDVGQVLVKIEYSTICASQRFEWMGLRGVDRHIPHVLGHEGFGRVVEVGPGVSRFKEGDEVVLTWIKQSGIECGKILYETIDKQEINSGKVSSFSEFAVVSENRLFLAPDVEEKNVLPLLGCAALTGAGIVVQFPCRSGRCLVVGAGGVGFFTVMKLLSEGLNEVHIIEKNEQRRAFFHSLSTSIRCYSSVADPEFRNELNENGLFEEVYEVSGDIELLQDAVSFTSMPGILAFATHPEYGKYISINPHDLIRGKEIRGSWGGGCQAEDVREKVTDFFVKNMEIIKRMVSEPFQLSQINEVMGDSGSSISARFVIKMSL